MTFIDDDDDNDDDIPTAHKKTCLLYHTGEGGLVMDQLVDENGAMWKAATDIMMSIVKNRESLDSNKLQVLGFLMEVGFNGNKKDDKRLTAIRVKGSCHGNPFEVAHIPRRYK